MKKKTTSALDILSAGARLGSAIASTLLGGSPMNNHNYPLHPANVAVRNGNQRLVDGVWVDKPVTPAVTTVARNVAAAAAAADEKKLLDTEEIIDKYWRRGDIQISRAAVILTRPYCRSLGDKIDYWTQYENWYKELSEMKRVHDNFDPENWARDYVVKMTRAGHWKTLNDQKFEAIVKRHVVGNHRAANAYAGNYGY